jgi:hypothetical protein
MENIGTDACVAGREAGGKAQQVAMATDAPARNKGRIAGPTHRGSRQLLSSIFAQINEIESVGWEREFAQRLRPDILSFPTNQVSYLERGAGEFVGLYSIVCFNSRDSDIRRADRRL